jgi:hypothetical protein
MGGPELFETVGRLGARPPFLFTSGYPERWSQGELEGSPDVAFLAKPFDLGTLISMAAELLGSAAVTS